MTDYPPPASPEPESGQPAPYPTSKQPPAYAAGPQQPGAQQPGPYGDPYGFSGSAAPVGPGGEPPLWAPWYGISFPKAFTRFWKKYATFSGRASRSEYWWWFLWSFIISVGLSLIGSGIAAATGVYSSQVTSSAGASFQTNPPATNGILGLWYLAILIPSIAIQVRRLHDVNLRGWFVLLNIIPFLGTLAVFVMTLLQSNPAGQRFDRPRA